MPKVNKVAHIVLAVKDVMVSVKFYTEVLGMEAVDLKENHKACFLSFGTQHHDIAVFEATEGAERGGIGLDHFAMQIEGGIPELNHLKQRLEEMGVTVTHTTDHTITKSVYFLDPDGNQLRVLRLTSPLVSGVEGIRATSISLRRIKASSCSSP